MLAELVVTSGPHRGVRVRLDAPGTLVVGREEGLSICLPEDPKVSTRHCEIRIAAGLHEVADLDSAHGTWVNDRRVPRAALAPGDRIRVGSSEIVLLCPPDEVDEEDVLPETTAPVLRMLSRVLAAGLDLRKAADLSLDLVVSTLGAHRGVLVQKVTEGQPRVLSSRHWQSPEDPAARNDFSRSVIAGVLDTGRSVHVASPTDEAGSPSGSVRALGIHTLLCVPVREGGAVVGAIYVDGRDPARRFSGSDAALVSAFARRIGGLLAALAAAEAGTETERRLRRQLDDSLARAQGAYSYGNIVGRSPRMREFFRLIERVAESSHPAIVEGESGTGKELVARAIHFNGPRKARPFVAESCGAIPESLMESELFGHVRGAFTGADRDRAGLFELADGGTLFLDELEDIPEEMQKKLLRVLEEEEVRRVGASAATRVDVRMVVATNRRVDALVGDGVIRQDLFYRLNVFRLFVPPLRERREDIPLLAAHFVEAIAREEERRVTLSDTALHALEAYEWPGNVRQLENALKRASALCEGVIGPEHLDLPASAPGAATPPLPAACLDPRRPYDEAHMTWEREFLQSVLEHFANDTAAAAASLGIDRSTLYRRLRHCGVRIDPWRAGG